MVEPGDSQEGSQVSCVTGNNNKAKQPPCRCHESSWECLRGFTTSLRSQGCDAEPQRLLESEVSLFHVVLVSLRVIPIRVWRRSIKEPQENRCEEVGSRDADPHGVLQDCHKLPVVISCFAWQRRAKEKVGKKCHLEAQLEKSSKKARKKKRDKDNKELDQRIIEILSAFFWRKRAIFLQFHKPNRRSCCKSERLLQRISEWQDLQ